MWSSASVALLLRRGRQDLRGSSLARRRQRPWRNASQQRAGARLRARAPSSDHPGRRSTRLHRIRRQKPPP
eukprot:4126833-Pyramimonas_sp.AAC.1